MCFIQDRVYIYIFILHIFLAGKSHETTDNFLTPLNMLFDILGRLDQLTVIGAVFYILFGQQVSHPAGLFSNNGQGIVDFMSDAAR